MTSPAYSAAQLESYLLHVSFPTKNYPQISSAAARSNEGLEYLSTLQKHQLTTVPFENLSLHYSQTKLLSLSPDDLFEKIVVKKRGGYCMENNQFFGTVLKSMGFEVVSTGARVFGGDGVMGGWSHQVSLVIIEGKTYLVDVGFGGAGPTRPLPLLPEITSSVGSTQASHRLMIEQPSNPITQPLWLLQHRISPEAEWKSLYGFTLTEFYARDYEVMNLTTSTSKNTWFTYMLVTTRMIMDEQGHDIVGIVALEGARLKRRIGSDTEELKTCKNEVERVEVLRQYFDIVLSEKEQKGILRTVTALPAR